MIRHLLKLVWHRKRANALVMTEIFFSFLVVFAVVTLSISLLARWRTPVGFSWQDVWAIEVDPASQVKASGTHMTPQEVSKDEIARNRHQDEEVHRIVRELRALPQIEAAAADAMPPFAERTWQSNMRLDGRAVAMTRDQTSDAFAQVLRIPLLRGRWFGPEDNGRPEIPVVLDLDAAEALFGKRDPLGRTFDSQGSAPGSNEANVYRVVGVIPPFRKDGELSERGLRMIFNRATPEKSDGPDVRTLLVRVRPGTPASFEAEFNQRLHAIAPDNVFRIRRMEQMRKDGLRIRTVPLIVLAVVATFLISMVALGLTGVLWQSVTRRMREIGLRRALGASARGVRRQILGEVALLSTLAMVVGVIVVLQLPLLGVLSVVSIPEFATGVLVALAVIYTITLLCGAYPSWLASTVQPAEALHYD